MVWDHNKCPVKDFHLLTSEDKFTPGSPFKIHVFIFSAYGLARDPFQAIVDINLAEGKNAL